MADVAATKAKWQKLAGHADPKVAARAKEVLAQLGEAVDPETVEAKPTVAKPPQQAPNKERGFFDRLAEATAYPEESKLIHDLPPDAQRTHAGRAVGLAAGAGAGALVARLLGPVVGAATGKLSGALARTAGAGAEGAVAGGVEGGTEAAVEGKDIGQGAKSGAEFGALAGGGLRAGGEAIGGLAGKIRKVPWIGRYLDAKDAGIYDDPAMKALEPGELGIQRSAEQARDRLIARDAQIMSEAGKQYDEAVTPLLQTPADPSAARMKLLELSMENKTSAGAPLRGGKVQDEVKGVIAEMGDEPTVEDMLKIRRSRREAAAFDSPSPTDEQSINRKTYRAVKEGLKETQEADNAYSAAKGKSARRRDILFRTEGDVSRPSRSVEVDDLPDDMASDLAAKPEMRVAREQASAANLKRVGDTNEPGLRLRSHLAELASQDPEIMAAIEWVAAKKALEGQRLSLEALLPSKFTTAAAASGFLPLIQQQGRAIGAKSYPLLRGAGEAATAGSKLAPLLGPVAPDWMRPEFLDDTERK